MLTYSMENRGDLPLYEYLYHRIRQDILDGTLTAGERLPSKRALAEHLRLSVITVESAYQQLVAEGYVYTLPKRGFFVSAVERSPAASSPAPVMPQPTVSVWTLDLRSNQVETSRFPTATWARLTRQVLSEDTFLSPVPHQGLPALRQAIADDLRNFRGMAVSPEQIVIGAGALADVPLFNVKFDIIFGGFLFTEIGQLTGYHLSEFFVCVFRCDLPSPDLLLEACSHDNTFLG